LVRNQYGALPDYGGGAGASYESVAIAQPDTTVVPKQRTDRGIAHSDDCRKTGSIGAQGIKQALTKTDLLSDGYTRNNFATHAASTLQRTAR